MVFLNADAILASSLSKSGKNFPLIDCDVIRLSIDLAISTSLIRDTVSRGNGVLTHTSVSNLTLQHWKSLESVNFPKCSSFQEKFGDSIIQF